MKKLILSIAIIAGVLIMSNINTANASEQPTITISFEDDGYVEVKIDDLNENVKNAISEIAVTYDVKTVKYNSEKKLTKVIGTNKEDQTEKVFIFNDEGKDVEKLHENSSELEEKMHTPKW